MSLDPTGMGNTQGINWKYSDPNDQGFIGTVLAIQEVQARNYVPNGIGTPKFWSDGNPVLNLRMLFALADGSFKSWTFPRASKRNVQDYDSGRSTRCVHMQLFDLVGRTRMSDLVGKTLAVSTTPGQYGAGNPRPFFIALAQEGPYQAAQEIPEEYKISPLLCNDGASGGQYNSPNPGMAGQYFVNPRPQQQQYQQPMQQYPMQQPQPYVQYQQPMVQQAQQMYQPQAMQQVMPQQQPMMQTQMQQPMTAPMPQGMDPAVAAAMQTLNAVNVQPVAPSPYDNDMPF